MQYIKLYNGDIAIKINYFLLLITTENFDLCCSTVSVVNKRRGFRDTNGREKEGFTSGIVGIPYRGVEPPPPRKSFHPGRELPLLIHAKTGISLSLSAC